MEEEIKRKLFSTRPEVEKVFLVAVEGKSSGDDWTTDDFLQELSRLVQTAGAKVAGALIQKRDKPLQDCYIGRGKIAELVSLRQQTQYNTVIFDDELSPRQQRNLEEVLQVKVVDRTTLILDIFAKKATTREGQLQVDLAQHQYILPRLVGQWGHLERLGGGIGTRGPGESQLETDRRLIHKRIGKLKQQIEHVRQHRALYRKQRRRSGIPVVALVGYTNAGKSTLFNVLSKETVTVEDKLFSTLDPVTRKLSLPDGGSFLITDTVGFIHKLPTSIIAAFRATLEEISAANLLLHIVDITSKGAANQCRMVEETLGNLNCEHMPVLMVLNKIDLVLDSEAEVNSLAATPFSWRNIMLPDRNTVMISAAKGWGIKTLLDKVASRLIIPAGDK